MSFGYSNGAIEATSICKCRGKPRADDIAAQAGPSVTSTLLRLFGEDSSRILEPHSLSVELDLHVQRYQTLGGLELVEASLGLFIIQLTYMWCRLAEAQDKGRSVGMA